MTNAEIKSEIIKALEGKEMDIADLFMEIHELCIDAFESALTTLTESGQIVCEDGRYKIKEK